MAPTCTLHGLIYTQLCWLGLEKKWLAEDPGTFLSVFPLGTREAGMFRSGWAHMQLFTFVLRLVGELCSKAHFHKGDFWVS